jgi:hypothetical protein
MQRARKRKWVVQTISRQSDLRAGTGLTNWAPQGPPSSTWLMRTTFEANARCRRAWRLESLCVNLAGPRLMFLSHAARCALTILEVAPLALLLGMACPTDLRLPRRHSEILGPWVRGVDVVATTIGTVEGVLASRYWGLSTSRLSAGIAAQPRAAASLPPLRRPSTPTCPQPSRRGMGLPGPFLPSSPLAGQGSNPPPWIYPPHEALRVGNRATRGADRTWPADRLAKSPRRRLPLMRECPAMQSWTGARAAAEGSLVLQHEHESAVGTTARVHFEADTDEGQGPHDTTVRASQGGSQHA